ncbi:MAG: hypothetical protein NVS2B12_29360 [Ktedonobacteraceae bacterium]
MITVRECTLETFSTSTDLLVDAVKVHTEVSHKGWAGSYHFFKRAEEAAGFRGLVALVGNKVVGTGFGYCMQPRFGNWWYEKVTEQVGAGNIALHDAWHLVTLDILEPYRDMNIAAALHDALLEAQPCSGAILSTEVSNRARRKFYEQMGWEYVHPNLILKANEPHHVVMYKKTHA